MAILRHRRNRSAMQVEPEFSAGSMVQFYSEASACWIDAIVENVTSAGDVQLSFWMGPADQARLLRPSLADHIDAGPWIQPKDFGVERADLFEEPVDAPAEFTSSQVSATDGCAPEEEVQACHTDTSFASSAATNLPDKVHVEDRIAIHPEKELANLRMLLEAEEEKRTKLSSEHYNLRESLSALRAELEQKADVESRLKNAEMEAANLKRAFAQAARLWPNVHAFRSAAIVGGS